MRLTGLHRPLGLVLRDQRGVAVLHFALLISVIFLIFISALDLIRAHLIRSRMWSAVDSSILAAGRSLGSKNWQDVGIAYFNANMGTVDGLTVDLSASSFQTSTTSVGAQEVSMTLNATAKLWSNAFGNIDTLGLSANAKALRRSQAVELVMVLDNTGSMGESNMAALRSDAQLLLTTLSGGATTGTMSYAKIGLVPYSAAVNPGAEAEKIVSTGTKYAPSDPLGWKGCVVERAAPDTLADTPATTAQWTPYVWKPGVDNFYDTKDASTVRAAYTYGNGSTGPNIGCPTPITPLTTDISKLSTAISAMRHWSRGGTLSDIGMAWGLRVLSPEAPFTEGTAWTNTNITKAVVLMTDGAAGFFKLTGDAAPNSENKSVVTDYTAYGRLDEFGLVGTSNKTTSTTIINNNLSALCTKMKGLGIQVYTITFGNLDSTTMSLYRSCASGSANYFNAPDQTSLQNAFESIGGSLTELTLTQ